MKPLLTYSIIEQKRDVYDRYGKEGLTGGKTKSDTNGSGHDKNDFNNKSSCFWYKPVVICFALVQLSHLMSARIKY